MLTFPNAKINIGLNVVNRRADGYHNLQTVFYPVNIQDALEIVESARFEFTSSGIAIPGRIADNLCVKAYHMIAADFPLPPVHIHLHKHIPIGAGLGGGSADAGFFIRLLNDKFQLNLSLAQMEVYARRLGADCAFFLHNKPVYAFGKGDEFEPLALNLAEYFTVLVMPDVHVSTAEAYRGVKPAEPAYSLRDAVRLPVEEWKSIIKNDFELSVFTNHPEVRGVKAALYEAGALYAAMSGSGASVFGIFKQEIALPDLEAENVVFYGV
ncbi:4-(cytidine 5'-diphospho)-2-C-methyl-D-erythritol kinase [Pedobacter sp. BS3]|uniref:4-(cytidine 5'-diphospho)-2-C-methyl-D-erythritol kinase n=1 Tax=Pedobacter sp. BS3 TaxID=2567937 RepID=UPI0011ED933F|nr:4-(cytidine 5'-diphospho)-2-C-methyl-D-erythritol kinase [Pedobacter sp. BS3]TZF85011.1 4-(cytidine 5'-diphospho)-2-C-methyl-D-erythritol kinase [Pedobacter sp. BS3]